MYLTKAKCISFFFFFVSIRTLIPHFFRHTCLNTSCTFLHTGWQQMESSHWAHVSQITFPQESDVDQMFDMSVSFHVWVVLTKMVTSISWLLCIYFCTCLFSSWTFHSKMALGIPAGLVLPPSLFSSFLSTKVPLRNEIRKVHYLCMCLYMFFSVYWGKCAEDNSA